MQHYPFGTPGNPVWLTNTWNNHPIVVDGSENITSIGNLLNQGTISNASAHVLSMNETGWPTTAPASNLNFGFVGGGGAVFGASLEDQDIIMVKNTSCKGFPEGHTAGDLVSWEGEHAGRLFLGGDLLLLNAGDDANEGTLSIQSGVYQDGSRLKHQTVSTGDVGPGGTVRGTLPWKTPFGDAKNRAASSRHRRLRSFPAAWSRYLSDAHIVQTQIWETFLSPRLAALYTGGKGGLYLNLTR